DGWRRRESGVGAVIQSLGVSAGPEVILKPTRVFSKATRVLVTAMEETDVKRLICVTGFGAHALAVRLRPLSQDRLPYRHLPPARQQACCALRYSAGSESGRKCRSQSTLTC